ncbi:hypothetical protein CLAFUW4_13018 [Fulvia fulva]|uniref:Uncharacterized protein n=1 Tax=Passalora fulva TaxID=5499 RepID=A0A9Q8PJT6_PASFU|nr:uncharacterized protein CLAFUR5_12879 [Fulvia fulva]KAK4612314.1 hypothetical protein CLAFUR4_13022 [Fulvia fulva]KAK4612819.1 hypothetical protein CLAFUR0_13026 [Fulvia fulva]UJO23689.1 hypothetical protein CLAFUR5_12879 [Fulvia fulva]WPV21525.1 hypothetical protein CLAFUW4_13018 [Fulvia fulva]WPV36342.1 hypothetical protein CLAFUW7_13025 [Fulvia fulva]
MSPSPLLLLACCFATTALAENTTTHTGRNIGIALGVVGGCAVIAVIFLVVRKKHLFVQIIPGLGETYKQGEMARQKQSQGTGRLIEMLNMKPDR